ncbi:MAG: BrnT family toxin [Methyloceanibacter sp.]|uniref:BrnT family toxin n=1 Tax=Methyloceanibacter sp. TaxID=1965321 RepID=UPI003D6D581B
MYCVTAAFGVGGNSNAPPRDEDDFLFEGFEWDPRKRRSNVVKHRIDFTRTQFVFSDPAAVTLEAQSRGGEIRQMIVGEVDGRLVTVVFTFREGRIRIISARRAQIGTKALWPISGRRKKKTSCASSPPSTTAPTSSSTPTDVLNVSRTKPTGRGSRR